MLQKYIRFLILCLGLLGLSSAVRADVWSDLVDGEWRLGVMGLYTIPMGERTVKENTKAAPSGSVILTKEISAFWSAGIAYDYFDLANDKTPSQYKYQMVTFLAGYSFFPEKTWTPFCDFGIGSGQTRGPFSQLALRLGLGLEYFISPDFSLRGGMNYYFLSKSSGENDEVHTLSPGLMLSWFFGGETRRKLREMQDQAPAEEVVEEEPEQTASPVDSDRDGIYDKDDHCPDTPKGVAVDRYGCPRDSDRDGVPDSFDLCPRTGRGIPVNKVGCPELPKEEKITVELKVYFAVDSSKVYFDHNVEDINRVAQLLQELPDIVAEIQGHTDSTGSRAHNIKLSKARAESVRQLFIQKYSVAPDRLTAIGFGPDKPVADNNTIKGREQNRRVMMIFSNK